MATATATLDARAAVLEFGDERISVNQVASPDADRLGMETVNCRRTARPGATTVGVCTVTQRPGRNPPSTNIRVTVDLRVFGRSAEYGLAYVFASGGAWDLDLAVPAGFPSGTVSLTFRITDAQGRSATATAPLVIQ